MGEYAFNVFDFKIGIWCNINLNTVESIDDGVDHTEKTIIVGQIVNMYVLVRLLH